MMAFVRGIKGQLFSVTMIGIGAALLSFFLVRIHAIGNIDAVAIDIRERAFPPRTTASTDIVLVVLDEATMQELPYRSPVPRDFLAALQERIAAAGPKVVGYDIFFKDPSFADADARFAKSLREHPAYGVVPRRPDGTVDEVLPLFRGALAGVGLADLPFDPLSEVVRSAQLQFQTQDGPRASFAALLFEAATGRSALESNSGNEFLIRFAGLPGQVGKISNAFRMYSAGMVAKGLVPPAWLAGKIVLVGAGYQDLKDSYLTPLSGREAKFATMTGVEIHANILSSLLTGELYTQLSPWAERAIVLFLALAIAVATVWISPARAPIATGVILLLYVAFAVVLFQGRALVLPIAGPLAAMTAAYGMGTLWRALTEGRERRFIKAAFAHYVPAAIVDRLVRQPELLALGGETRIVTSLFTDIASFTTISERLDPQALVAFLNEYLGRMNEALFRFGATLDKYEGDAIIAFFNAPVAVEDHELAAANAALSIRKASADLSRTWGERCGRDIVTRAGLATGPAVVGNMGSENRFDYTAIGDTINLASRLEGANKFYGTTILASEMTVRALGDAIATRPVDRVHVKGKREPTLLFELVGDPVEIDRRMQEGLLAPYREAFDCFLTRDLARAAERCRAILTAFPEDGPTRGLLALCERASREAGWDLVTELTEK